MIVFFMSLTLVFKTVDSRVNDLHESVEKTKNSLRIQTDQVHRIDFDDVEVKVYSDHGELSKQRVSRLLTKIFFGQRWYKYTRDPSSKDDIQTIEVRNEKNVFTVEKSLNGYKLTRARVAEPWIDFDWPRDGAILVTPTVSLDWLLSSPETELSGEEVTEIGRRINLVFHGEIERRLWMNSKIAVQFDRENRVRESTVRFKKDDTNYVFRVRYEYADPSNMIPIRAEFRRQKEGSAAYESFEAENISVDRDSGDPEKLRPEFYGISQAAVDARSGVAAPPTRFNIEFWAWIGTAIICTGASVLWGRSKLRGSNESN